MGALAAGLRDDDARKQQWAAEGLGRLSEGIGELRNATEHEYSGVSEDAQEALRIISDALDSLRESRTNDDEAFREAATHAFNRLQVALGS